MLCRMFTLKPPKITIVGTRKQYKPKAPITAEFHLLPDARSRGKWKASINVKMLIPVCKPNIMNTIASYIVIPCGWNNPNWIAAHPKTRSGYLSSIIETSR